MSTTIPREFTGTPELTPDRLETIKEWYRSSLGDEDKASDIDDASFYEGYRMACERILSLLHGTLADDDAQADAELAARSGQ